MENNRLLNTTKRLKVRVANHYIMDTTELIVIMK